MVHSTREKLKSFVLLVLVVVCVAQMGILWIYQSQGSPFLFFDRVLGLISAGNDTGGMDRLKDGLFMPGRVIVTEEGTESHWLAARGSDSYNRLWTDARFYLYDILTDDACGKPEQLSLDKWGPLVSSKPFCFTFSTGFDINLLKFFFSFDKSISANAPPGLTGLIISPWDDDSLNTVYINDGTKVYKYRIPFLEQSFSKEEYSDMLKSFIDSRAPVYKVFHELDPDFQASISVKRDIPIATNNSGPRSYRDVRMTIPEAFRIKDTGDPQYMDEMAQRLLGDDRDNYDAPDVDTPGTIVFRNLGNMVKLDGNGLFEYRHLAEQEESGRSGSADAVIQALTFMKDRMAFLPDTDLYISGISSIREGQYWKITFDYIVGGVPVYFNSYKIITGETARTLHNAVTVIANGKRVLNCWWFLRSFEPGHESTRVTADDGDLMARAFSRIKELAAGRSVTVRDLFIAYNAGNNDGANSRVLKPVFVVSASTAGAATQYFTVDIG